MIIKTPTIKGYPDREQKEEEEKKSKFSSKIVKLYGRHSRFLATTCLHFVTFNSLNATFESSCIKVFEEDF